LPVAGDDPAAKAVVLKLVDELGFEGVDAGGLDESWRPQPGSPVYTKDGKLCPKRGRNALRNGVLPIAAMLIVRHAAASGIWLANAGQIFRIKSQRSLGIASSVQIGVERVELRHEPFARAFTRRPVAGLGI
jgi:hypothetical protein